MTHQKFTLRPESASDHPAIEALLNTSFGPGRFARTANRLREGVGEIPQLSVVAMAGETLVGSLRYWPVLIGGRHRALLLGPLAVHPDWQGQGCGLGLMQQSLPIAAESGHRLVVLVGDLSYYSRAGFSQVPAGTIDMPGPVDRSRLMWLELVSGASDGVSGVIGKYR